MQQASQNYTGTKGQEYFDQRNTLINPLVQKRRAALFLDLADPKLTILDFGCGNGGLLSILPAAKRLGVEVSEHAAKQAREKLDVVVASTNDVEDETADIAISHHALEHVSDPATILAELYRLLKPGGQLRIVVPCEMPLLLSKHRRWSNNIEQHLFTWTPLTLGNLVAATGFEINNATLAPKSTPGKLIGFVSGVPKLKILLLWIKSLTTGKFDTIVTARKPY